MLRTIKVKDTYINKPVFQNIKLSFNIDNYDLNQQFKITYRDVDYRIYYEADTKTIKVYSEYDSYKPIYIEYYVHNTEEMELLKHSYILNETEKKIKKIEKYKDKLEKFEYVELSNYYKNVLYYLKLNQK